MRRDVAPVDLAAVVDEFGPTLLDRARLASMLAEDVARGLPDGPERERASTAVAALHDLTRALGDDLLGDDRHDHRAQEGAAR